jgi:flagellar biosynthetic protein FliR
MTPILENPALWAFTQTRSLVWMLILVRMTGLLATMPGFGQARIPVRIRLTLGLLLAIVLLPLVPTPRELPTGMYDLTGIMVTEFAAGLIMGLAVSWIVDIVAFAGQLMDTQMGFSFVQLLDPVSAHPVSISGSLLTQLTLIFIFVSNLHHQMILAVVASYRILPIGQALPMKPELILTSMGQILVRGFQLAFPVMLTLFLVDVLEGVSGKFMPQLQLIQLSFPIKIAVGLTMLGIVLREFPYWLQPLLEDAPRVALRLIS